MPAIITITLNPTIDKSTTVDALVPEKKLHCSRPVFEPGGGGINVARAIKKLGGEATAIYFAGGYNGVLLKQLLAEEEVDSLIIETKKDTRENLIVVDKATNLQYRFGMPGPQIEQEEWHECLKVIELMDDLKFIIASGSLPPGVPNDIFARIAAIAKKKNARLIVDTSEEALKLAAKEGMFLMKPNLGELSSLVDQEELTVESVQDVAKKIIAEGKCEVIVISMGSAGAMVVTKDVCKQIVAPPVKRRSTVGAGDSMMAGIVLSLYKGKSLIDAIKYGVACGTAATMNAGTELCKLKDVETLYAALNSN